MVALTDAASLLIPCVTSRDAGIPLPLGKTQMIRHHKPSVTISVSFLNFFGFSPQSSYYHHHTPKSLPSARISGFCLQRRDTGQCRDEVSINLNPMKEDLLIQEFVVVMQQHRRVVHGGKANCRATCLKYIGRRSSCEKASPEQVSRR